MLTIEQLMQIKSIRITSKVSYEILWVPEFADKENVGECRYEDKQIVLKMNESATETTKTLIHEILHAIDYEHNVGLPHAAIYAMEQGVLSFLVLNQFLPKLKGGFSKKAARSKNRKSR